MSATAGRGFFRRLHLAPKMLLITLFVGAAVWAILDPIQTKNLKDLSDAHQMEALSREAQENRLHFDSYVEAYHEAAKLIIQGKSFHDYAGSLRGPWSGVKYYSEIPPWLPDASIMRHFVYIQYALLLDGKGDVREVYRNAPDQLPSSILKPGTLLGELSHNQSFMTTIDGVPFLLSSETLAGRRGRADAVLMLAARLDNDFLMNALGADSANETVALISKSIVIASNKPDLIRLGASMDNLKKDYFVTGKSFFDQGSSDLVLQFASLLSRYEMEKLNASVLRSVRIQRATIALAMVFSTLIVVFWITRHIRKLTAEITDVSQNMLKIRLPEMLHRDELRILEDQFHYFTTEIVETRELLRQKTEKLLQEKTTYLDSIMNSSHFAIAATDLDFRIKYYNPAAEKLFGYKAGDVIGKTVLEIHLREKVDHSRFESAIEQVKRENLYSYSVKTHSPDGIRFLESKVSGIRDKDGELVGFVLMSSDVTDKIRIENEIKGLAKFPDENPSPVVRLSKEGVILYANKASAPLLDLWNCRQNEKVPEHVLELATNIFNGGSGREFDVETGGRIFSIMFTPLVENGYLNIYGKDVTQRQNYERRLASQYAVTRILAESATFDEAVPRLLKDICLNIGWEMGEFWRVEADLEALVWEGSWRVQGLEGEEFDRDSRNRMFEKGAGLPGRAWKSGKPLWISDSVTDDNFPRASIASRAGLRGAFAFPVLISDAVAGVMCFFSSEVREPDGDLLNMFYSLGSQIGDFIERKRTESALQESEKKFRSLFENMTEGMALHQIVFDMEGAAADYRILDVNPAYYRHTGLEPGTAEGKLASEFYRTNAPPYLDIYAEVAEGGEPRGFEVYFQPMQKHFRILAFSTSKGTFVTVFEDISKRKYAEEMMKQYSGELARSNKELELFASIASHDLQEPLRAVSGFAQLLEKRYKGRMDADADEFLSFIVDGAARMQQLIRDLLEYSRVTTRGKPFSPTDFNKTVRMALQNLTVAIEENGAEIICGELPTIVADESQMVRLLQNLIGNAIKYHGEERPAIRVSANRQEDGEWVFSVADNGIGIDEQYYERIFRIFQRLHKRDTYSGTGIGLAVCKRIVEKHGGRIWVESEPGRGSVFYFTIPEIIN